MIISASRRTDIPAFYADWFYARLREGFVLVRNPVNPSALSRVDLSPEAVDGIVFWTKNPLPMLERLGELDAYPYYFHFTVNAYSADIEERLPPLSERIETFKRLSNLIGPERVLWRYNPVLLSPKYPPAFHEDSFGKIAENLSGHTKRCVFSFLDFYPKIRAAMDERKVSAPGAALKARLAEAFTQTALPLGIEPQSCCDTPAPSGVRRAACIDARLLSKIAGHEIRHAKDRGQRPECLCAKSADIGSYDTCLNGCAYCYANSAGAAAAKHAAGYDAGSPMLCSRPRPGDTVAERKKPPRPERQMGLFDCEA